MMTNFSCTQNENHITIAAFIHALMARYRSNEMNQDAISYGYLAGWLEDQDVTGKNALLTRKTAARILHNFMRKELKETDETNIRPSQKLQDLYDCRSCVGHITQIYVKGILNGFLSSDNRFIFGMDALLSHDECKEMIERCLLPSLRQAPSCPKNHLPAASLITYDKALSYIRRDQKLLLIDVRPSSEYEEFHLVNAVSIPLMSILKNPYQVCEVRDRRILLYCNE
ncbi:MAG: rhodanese-like domain-containing protein, partial [Lachnospiraceae bacterium]|nr:rhodanese-like domain-containing protein [Lachnospiraceae bacterium]